MRFLYHALHIVRFLKAFHSGAVATAFVDADIASNAQLQLAEALSIVLHCKWLIL